jgi:hypothetical protein
MFLSAGRLFTVRVFAAFVRGSGNLLDVPGPRKRGEFAAKLFDILVAQQPHAPVTP